jgi:SAM-dependent methyltransferase
MSPTESARSSASERSGTPLEFLCVDEFLRTLVDARALKTAFELGLVDRLLEQRSAGFDALARAIGADRPGMRLLVDLLAANQVVEERGGKLRLHQRFAVALRYRDLLETKLDFAGFTLNDFADLFTALVKTPGGGPSKGRLFELFDYRRCFEPTPENYQRTRGWMRLTSTLTRYEARACLQLHDFSRYRRMLDIGGNSGEFALQLCRRHSGLRATVLDLPLVCEIGLEHVLAHPEHPRITFLKADLRNDVVPGGYDLITFKSMLHDWPEADAQRFLAKAVRALEPGGTLLVFERGPIQLHGAAPPFSMLPILLFFRAYRGPAAYARKLEDLGLAAIECRQIDLDTPFFLLCARKPAPQAA